jgi:hypothetical protein
MRTTLTDVTVPIELAAKVREAAEAENVPVSELIRRGLARLVGFDLDSDPVRPGRPRKRPDEPNAADKVSA